jgi:hypothetical protein
MPGTYTIRIGSGGRANQRGGDTIIWHNELLRFFSVYPVVDVFSYP